MTKICMISDTHGYLPEIPECDIFIHAGDICPVVTHELAYQNVWLRHDFLDWLIDVPAKYKVFIPGNHDYWFEKNRLRLEPNEYCLIDEFVDCGLKIWGSPWQKFFMDWAFNAPEGDEDEVFLSGVYKKIPAVDIIVSHGPPYGYGDLTPRKESVGSKALLKRIEELQPKLVVTGHIHCARGIYEIDHGQTTTTVINAAYLNERYKPQGSVFEVEL